MALPTVDLTNPSVYHKALLEGIPSTPSEVSYAYVDFTSGTSSPKGTILLIHGYPETSYQFRHVIPMLAQAGYRIVAPDYRGAGHSSKPRAGYDKFTVANDHRKLLRDHLKLKGKIHVVGHDIGGMIAHAFAAQFPDDTACVAWGECPLPGTSLWDEFLLNPGVFHFHFHWQADLPETMTAGREEIWIKHFYDRLTFQPGAISADDVAYYGRLFKQPGAMRAGFDMYRAFHQDVEDNKSLLKDKGKCKVPCTTMNGENSFLAQIAEKQTREMYENVEVATVAGSGHWCAEENPEDFVKKVLAFIEKHT